MSVEEIVTNHEYILDNDLLNVVESNTKKNWRGAGSRTTYYNAIIKSKRDEELTLVEGLMLMEAQDLVKRHKKENEMALAATA